MGSVEQFVQCGCCAQVVMGCLIESKDAPTPIQFWTTYLYIGMTLPTLVLFLLSLLVCPTEFLAQDKKELFKTCINYIHAKSYAKH